MTDEELPTETGTPALTYPGGFARLMARHEAGHAPYTDHQGVTPPADLDLEAAETTLVLPPSRPVGKINTDLADKRMQLSAEFTGRPELYLTHALLVAILRRRPVPDHVPGLFQRVWAEKGWGLARGLSSRWLVSAATTFADHGTNEAQRRAGLSLSLLMGTMQLYESERLHSGLRANEPFRFGKHPQSPLPLGLGRYAISRGDLDINLLTRIWHDGEQDRVIRPLCATLLTRLNVDDGTVFRRLMAMRRAKRNLPR